MKISLTICQEHISKSKLLLKAEDPQVTVTHPKRHCCKIIPFNGCMDLATLLPVV